MQDGLNFFSKITPKKTLNAANVLGSYYVSKWTKKPVQWGMPMSVSIEPTTACNLRCPECPSGLRQFTRETGNLKEDFFKTTIDQLADHLLYLTFYFQGEPYINPKFLEMVNYASCKGIYTATSTNAHFLNEENAKKTVESGLDRLIISIDGTTQQTYESYRIGGELEKVIEGTKNIIKWKKKLKSKTPHVIFQFLVVRPNEHQIEDVKKLGKELGVDEVKFKTAQIYDHENGNDLIPTIEKYSRYRKNGNGKYAIKNQMLNHCWKLWHSCVITWDGLVVPCCFDKDATHRLGDLKERNFKEIWFNGNYARFRSAVLKSRKEIDICKNCSEGTKVWT
ncbi:MAG: radical SAM protein [Flavobacteriales bacterium]|nr:SPASM domain-containing protein [Bacteroidia bacterium]MBN4061862.1 SPASM domain-containing protein [Bacteroidales bacterium AH-315-I05]PCJ84936.1 MAG: radical SAM protein [Flavobacteriales bacterium]